MKPASLTSIVFASVFSVSVLGGASCDGEKQCREEIQAGVTCRLTLAAKSLSEFAYPNGYSGEPSCTGVDNLAVGNSLDIAIPEAGEPVHFASAGCLVPEGVVESDIGLTLVDGEVTVPAISAGSDNQPMLLASGAFSTGQCTGRCGFLALIRPADSSGVRPVHEWAGRVIELDRTSGCQEAFPAVAASVRSLCFDAWDLDVQRR